MELIERVFHLRKNKTTVGTEVRAGVTTFMTMAYILAVNPSILSAAGMDKSAVLVATALASAIGTFCMAFFANYPFALAPGMGLNAYFAYTVVLGMGYTWQMALAAVLVEGIIFIILSFLNVREQIFDAIPQSLKKAVSVGIGLFIFFIGLQNAKIAIADSSTCVDMYSFAGSDFRSEGITVLLAIIGILITGVLLIKKVRGGILWGILSTWVLGMICQLVCLYVPNPEIGMYSLFPDFSQGISLSLSPTFMKFDFSNMFSFEFVIVVFAFLFVDMFDTLGTLIGVASQSNMLDKNDKLPKIKGALLADAVATVAGACLGTSTTTTFVESASGVEEGGRTGLTSFTTGVLFVLALVASPIFLAIPSFATAPALVAVGCMMIKSAAQFDISNYRDFLPACLCLAFMAFTYSIANGIVAGVISYTVLNACTGNAKKVHPLMYILSVLFVLKFIFI